MLVDRWRIPLSDLDYSGDEEQAVVQVLRNRWLSMGSEVTMFETEFADLLGVGYAIAVASGTAALHLASLAIGIGPGDEVIQPALNFVAAANVTTTLGATPVFADIIALSDPTVSPADITRLLSPSTRAVVVMHYGGHLCRMKEILSICRNEGIAVIEDACHAIGGRLADTGTSADGGLMAGTIGDVGCFSFFSNKNVATGEGGMVVTSNAKLAERVRCLRSHGMTTMTWDRHHGHAARYDVVAAGFNYRMDELHAALGRVQLRKLSAGNRQRHHLVEAYRSLLDLPAGWVIPFLDRGAEGAYHLMSVVAPNPSARAETASALSTKGIQTSLHYPSIPGFSAYSGLRAQPVPLTEEYSSRVITLPLFPRLAESAVRWICSVLNEAAAAAGSSGAESAEKSPPSSL